jgi:hypothetical protein
MRDASHAITLRIAWCRQQIAKARTEPEMHGWRAEEAGLTDALLNSDHTNDYRHSTPEVFERYVLGLGDGAALIRAARMDLSQPR